MVAVDRHRRRQQARGGPDVRAETERIEQRVGNIHSRSSDLDVAPHVREHLARQ
jgi:hypothetical protein